MDRKSRTESTPAPRGLRDFLEIPYDELEELWQLLLLHQFHDILPGSSIAWVHQDAEHNHAALLERAEAIITCSLAALVGSGERELVANAAPHARGGVVAFADHAQHRAAVVAAPQHRLRRQCVGTEPAEAA